MPHHLGLHSFYRDQTGLTGAEKALTAGFGLAIISLVGVLTRGGSEQAAGDAARTLAKGSASLGAMASTATLSAPQLLHAAGTIARPAAEGAAPGFPRPAPPSPERAAALAPAAPAAPAPAPPATAPPLGQLTIGDTAGAKRSFTDKVYQHNLSTVSKAKINVTSSAMKADLQRFIQNWDKNHARYEAVSAKTGVPAPLIAALHWRESSGNFNTYLHQGDPLGKPAVHVPRNIPVFYKWEDAAVNALDMKKTTANDLGLTAQTTDLAAMATYAEYYNGLGYYNRGRISPYVYSGTDQYQKGKYVADGVYDPNAKDGQLGVVTLIESISGGVQAPGAVTPPAAPPATPNVQAQPPAAPAPVPAGHASSRYFLRRRSSSARAFT